MKVVTVLLIVLCCFAAILLAKPPPKTLTNAQAASDVPQGGEGAGGSAAEAEVVTVVAPTTVIAIADPAVLARVRPILRELSRYSGTARATEQGRGAAAGPYRGNLIDMIAAAIGYELQTRTFIIFGDGALSPYFQEFLNRLD